MGGEEIVGLSIVIFFFFIIETSSSLSFPLKIQSKVVRFRVIPCLIEKFYSNVYL